MIIYAICASLLIVALWSYVLWLKRKGDKLSEMITRTNVKIFELEDSIKRVDEATGTDVYRLSEEFRQFKEEYGEAAIEEKRQAAKAEKAWAEGVQNIINYAPLGYGRGDTK